MKCSASQITCTAHKSNSAAQTSAAREAASQFEAMLFAKALTPVAKAMGFYGDLVVDAATQAMTRGSDDSLVRAMLERANTSNIDERVKVAGDVPNTGEQLASATASGATR